MKKLMAALLGAVLVGWASWGAEPVRVGVFTGAGACSVGMLRWIQIACRSPELTPTYIDGAAVRAGALDKLDLVIMPGGWAGREYEDLGQDGVAKLKKFIHDGGSYIGTCAGCFLVMDDSTKQHPRLELMPYVNQQGPYLFGTILSAEFSSRAKELLGVRPGEHRVRYHGGPLMIPSKKAIPEANFEIVGTYKGDINPGTNTRTKTMTGTGCAAVGTYGKGRVVAYAIHPEYFPNSMDLVKGAFKYTTGRDITIRMPQRKPGQLAVGLLGDWAIGVESANACRDLFVRDDFDVVPLMEEICAEGMMRHLDVLVIPNMEKSPNSLRQNIYSAKARRRYEEFLARGGKIVSWGDAAKIFPCDRRNFFAIKSTELVAKLNALKNDSFAAPEAPVLKPVRAAVYADKGVSCAEYWNVSKLMACSPLYRVTFVNAADIANGVLKDFDLLLMGGGLSTTQYRTLGEKGRQAVIDFVHNGGAYYGICAGAFLSLQTANPKRPRLGLVPFKEQTGIPYRGWCETRVEFTDEAAPTLGFMGGSRRFVLYWGGPEMLPGDPIPGTDVKVLAKYYGHMVNTFTGGSEVKPMTGSGAIIGGTCGKGRLVASGPHPECSEDTQDIVRAILKYLTGRPAEPNYPNRKKGAICVAFGVSGATKEGMTFGMELMKDPRFDVLPNTGYETGHGALDHADVLFMPWPVEKGYVSGVYDFLAKGGRVIEYDPQGKGKETHPNLIRVKTFDEARQAMLDLKKEVK